MNEITVPCLRAISCPFRVTLAMLAIAQQDKPSLPTTAASKEFLLVVKMGEDIPI